MKAKTTAAPKKTATKMSAKTQTTAPKKVITPSKHNKRFPIQKTSRTNMVKILNDTRGRFFTSTHVDKEGQLRTMNAVKSNKSQTELGYIMVYSMKDKGLRNINPQTLTELSFGGVHYVAKR